LGQQGKFSEAKNVIVEKVYTYDDKTMIYGGLAATASVASTASDSSNTCSCANALK